VILSNHLATLTAKEFLCQVSFMEKTVRFAKSIYDTKKKDLRATQAIFKNVPEVKTEFSKEISPSIWYKRIGRQSSGDFTRKMAFKMDASTIPDVLFQSIQEQLSKILPLAEINRETNIKQLLDIKFNGKSDKQH
jgi:hypothetical protein